MPKLTHLEPAASLPGGEVTLEGTGLSPELQAEVAGVPALVTLARPTRATIRIPEGVLPGNIVVTHAGVASNPLPLNIAVAMAENLHPVANPAVDALANVYTP